MKNYSYVERKLSKELSLECGCSSGFIIGFNISIIFKLAAQMSPCSAVVDDGVASGSRPPGAALRTTRPLGEDAPSWILNRFNEIYLRITGKSRVFVILHAPGIDVSYFAQLLRS